MGDFIVNLLNSKKFMAMVGAVIATVIGGITGALEWGIVITLIVGEITVYVGAQGVADIGKERAKIESGNGGNA